MARGASPGERRGGRAKGTPNKLSADVRSMILKALADAGGQGYLAKQAKDNPTAFLSLLGKLLPKQVDGKLDAKLTGHIESSQKLDTSKLTLEQLRVLASIRVDDDESGAGENLPASTY